MESLGGFNKMKSPNMYNSPEVAAKIKLFAKSKNISLKDLLNDCELGSNTFSHMLHGKSIAYDSLARIADYLECSIDFLLGRTNVLEEKIKNSPAETDEGAVDEYIIHRLMSLTPEELAQVDAFVQGLLANRKE